MIKRIGFTGSGNVGQLIQQRAATVGVKHISLELGGKNPLIVFPDADLDKAVAGAIHGMNFGVCQGQSCGSNSRILLHSSIHDEFVERMKSQMDQIVVGRAYDPGTQMGPLVSKKQYDRVLGYIGEGKSSGAKLVTGGSRPASVDEQGYFLSPTIFTNVDMSMSIAKEEIFGPVVSVSTWNDYDSMIHQANDVEYGLTASIWSEDLSLALKTAEKIEAGYIWVNDANRHYWGVPFGGMKNSGLGREESMHELLSYMELQAINVIMKDPGTRLAEITGNKP
jgi:acyl-CoA reductase-like NAD-dependent aldehyde dehydrogenase